MEPRLQIAEALANPDKVTMFLPVPIRKRPKFLINWAIFQGKGGQPDVAVPWEVEYTEERMDYHTQLFKLQRCVILLAPIDHSSVEGEDWQSLATWQREAIRQARDAEWGCNP